MSALFFKVSWPHTIEKYRALQLASKRMGFRLSVKNVSRTRGIPVFLFFLDRGDGKQPSSFHSLDDVERELAKVRGDGMSKNVKARQRRQPLRTTVQTIRARIIR